MLIPFSDIIHFPKRKNNCINQQSKPKWLWPPNAVYHCYYMSIHIYIHICIYACVNRGYVFIKKQMCIFSCVYVYKFSKKFFVNPREFSLHVLKLDSWEILTSTMKVAAYRFILAYQTQKMKAKKHFFLYLLSSLYTYLFLNHFFCWVSCARQFTSCFHEIVMDVRNLIFTLKICKMTLCTNAVFLIKTVKKIFTYCCCNFFPLLAI